MLPFESVPVMSDVLESRKQFVECFAVTTANVITQELMLMEI